MQPSQSNSEKRYTYAELEGSAKDRARQHYIEHWIDDYWYECVFDELKAEAVERGFHIDEISFSGFWSQGDGAMWVGDVHLPTFIKHSMPESIGRDCWLWLLEDACIDEHIKVHRTGHHYSHEYCMGIGNAHVYDHEPDDLLQYACILKGTPIGTLWDLIVADTACPIKSVDDLEELVLTEARNYAREIYLNLEEAYQSECSDENIGENYYANDQFFNHEGEQL